MKNLLLILGFSFSLLIAQTTLVPSLFTSIGGVIHWDAMVHLTINMIFLVLMYICFSRNFFSAMAWFFTLVLLQNSFDVPWKGSLAVSYFFMIVIIYALETMFVFQYSLSTMMVIFLLIIIQNFFHLFIGSISVGFESPFYGEWGRLILVSIISTVIAPMIFYVLYRIDAGTIFYFNKNKSFFGRRLGL